MARIMDRCAMCAPSFLQSLAAGVIGGIVCFWIERGQSGTGEQPGCARNANIDRGIGVSAHDRRPPRAPLVETVDTPVHGLGLDLSVDDTTGPSQACLFETSVTHLGGPMLINESDGTVLAVLGPQPPSTSSLMTS